MYLNADIEGRRFITGSMFPEKWTYLETGHRTTIVNEAASLIYQINSKLDNKKTRIRTSIRTVSGFVPLNGVMSNHFIEDLKQIATLGDSMEH